MRGSWIYDVFASCSGESTPGFLMNSGNFNVNFDVNFDVNFEVNFEVNFR